MSAVGQRAITLQRALVLSAAAVVAMTLLHDLDHLRQGRDLPLSLDLVGAAATSSSVVVLLWVHRGGVLGTRAAVVFGALTALGLVAVHVVPRWSSFSDPYSEAGVDVLSWVGLAALITAALILTIVAGRRLHTER